MKISAALLSLSLLLSASGPALAAATPEEAQRITAVLQSYLGPTPGVVSVTPQGEGYATRIDLAPLFAKVNDPAFTFSLSPLEWTITAQGGGKWKLEQNQPLSFAVGVNGQSETVGTIASLAGSAIFDEALGALASSSFEIKGFRSNQKVTEKGQEANITIALETLTITGTVEGTADRADGITRQSYQGLRETISMPAAADGSSPALDITLTFPAGSHDVGFKGMRIGAINNLMTWFATHPSKEAMVAGQAELKDKLRAALPLFDSLSAEGTMTDVTVGSMVGVFGVKQLTTETEMSGPSTDGRLRQTLAVTGLQMPGGLLPPWAAGLVPETFNVDMAVAGFNLAAPAALMLDKLDLSKPEPLPGELDALLVQALLPGGTVAITLGPSQIMAKLFDVTAEGSMTAGPIAMPAGQATVLMKGMDQTMAALQSGPPDLQQMGPLLLLMKGLGKQEADGALSWKIESTPAGAITVNGADLSKMMGGQQ